MKFKSVYERSYKHFACVNKDYLENLKYRIQRQANERSHHPIEWPGESSDSDTSSSTTVQESHRPRAVSSDKRHDVSHDKTSFETTSISPCKTSPGVTKDEFVQVDWDSSLSELSLTSDGSDPSTININKRKKADVSRAPRPSGDVKVLDPKDPTNEVSKRKTQSLPLRSLENRDGVSSNLFKRPSAAVCQQSELPARTSWPKVDLTDSQSHNSVQPKATSVRFTSSPTRKNCAKPFPPTEAWTSEYSSKFASYPTTVYSKSAAAIASYHLPPTSKMVSKKIRNANVDKITARMSSSGYQNYILDNT